MYKRQLYIPSGRHQSFAGLYHHVGKFRKILFERSVIFQKPPLNPVSYTHLDVYKRQELEREASTLLFERYPKQVVLTPTGRLLLDKSEALLELYREVEKDLNRLDSQSALRIGSCITIANDRLPQLCLLYTSRCV